MKIVWIDVTLKCNLRCSYCDAKTQILSNTISDFERFKKIQNFIQTINQDFEVRICGGEPTLFKFFYELLDILYNNDFVKKIIIYSNCINEIKRINSKILIITSLHFEYNHLWNIVLKNTLKFPTVYNILIKDFESYPYLKDLKLIFKQIPKYSFIHFQYITRLNKNHIKDKGTWENYKKFLDFAKKFNVKEYYKVEPNCYGKIAYCKCNSIKIKEDGSVETDCSNFNLKDFYSEKKMICKNISCSIEEILDHRCF